MNAISMTERVLTFGCGGDRLVGIFHQPVDVAETGVVVVVGGPQYRAGSHRQFVLFARAMAQAGFAVLRFDCRGMGDSVGEPRSFEAISDDIGAAIDALLQQAPNVKQVALWGLCDGASAILLYLHETSDRRVGGLCLLNPWVRSKISMAHTHVRHYYARRMMQREFWAKLLRGEVGASALTGAARNLRLALFGTPVFEGASSVNFRERMARAWRSFHGRVLLILSGDDYTAREFVDAVDAGGIWHGLWQKPGLERCDVPRADHTFSNESDRRRVDDTTLRWLKSLESRSDKVFRQAAAGILLFLAQACVFAGAGLLAANAAAQERASICGPLVIAGAFGPFDYRTQRDTLAIVETHHFTPEVESLIRGITGSVGAELSYTLHAFPNHHRALVAMMRLAERMKVSQPLGARYTIECYFDRALRFAPDDTVARTLYASFLARTNRDGDADAQLERASRDAADNPFTQYNVGLVYLDLKRYDKALRQAHRAMALGFPKSDLIKALKETGHWNEPSGDIPPSAASASAPQTDKD